MLLNNTYVWSTFCTNALSPNLQAPESIDIFSVQKHFACSHQKCITEDLKKIISTSSICFHGEIDIGYCIVLNLEPNGSKFKIMQ